MPSCLPGESIRGAVIGPSRHRNERRFQRSPGQALAHVSKTDPDGIISSSDLFSGSSQQLLSDKTSTTEQQ